MVYVLGTSTEPIIFCLIFYFILPADTPLHEAVRHGLTACISELLRHGSDVNHRNTMGYSPLHLAVHNTDSFNLTIVKELVKNGYEADVNQPDGNGKSCRFKPSNNILREFCILWTCIFITDWVNHIIPLHITCILYTFSLYSDSSLGVPNSQVSLYMCIWLHELLIAYFDFIEDYDRVK